MIVDDDEAHRVTLRRHISAMGHRITSAANGEEALNRLSDASPDILLTDVRMPGIDGFDLLRREYFPGDGRGQLVLSLPFFMAGSVGMLRLPDAFARLHATTKADNVGLGLVVLGLLMQADSIFEAAKLVLIWLLVVLASATACHLIAQSALRRGARPWSKS